MANKDFKRIDLLTGLEDSRSRLFVDPGTARIADLSNVRLLHCGVDTVRQLYRGLIRPEVMALFEKPGVMVEFAGEFSLRTDLPTSGAAVFGRKFTVTSRFEPRGGTLPSLGKQCRIAKSLEIGQPRPNSVE